MARLTRDERETLRQRIDEATRAAMPPANRHARPGHPTRFQSLTQIVSRGREVRHPSLQWYDDLPPATPRILSALNG